MRTFFFTYTTNNKCIYFYITIFCNKEKHKKNGEVYKKIWR